MRPPRMPTSHATVSLAVATRPPRMIVSSLLMRETRTSRRLGCHTGACPRYPAISGGGVRGTLDPGDEHRDDTSQFVRLRHAASCPDRWSRPRGRRAAARGSAPRARRWRSGSAPRRGTAGRLVATPWRRNRRRCGRRSRSVPMRRGAPPSRGASVRPSALVIVSFSTPVGAAAELLEHDPDARGRLARYRVQHVRGEPPVRLRFAGALHGLDEPQARDVADLLQRGGALGLEAVGEPPLELAQDRIARVAAHADDEGHAEARRDSPHSAARSGRTRPRSGGRGRGCPAPGATRPSWRRRGRPCRRAPDGRG